MKLVFSLTARSITIGLMLLLASCHLHAQNRSANLFYDSTWTMPYKPFRVAGNLYYVGTYDLASYLITTGEGHILINTGLEESVSMIRQNVEALGFKFSDIKILLTTQAHYDHVAGMAEVKSLTNAKLMVVEADVKAMEDGGSSDFIFGGNGITFKPVSVDQRLKDGDTVRIGDTNLKVLHHPGHTKGSASYLVSVKDEQRSWTVLIANIPSILPQTRLSGMPAYPNVGKDYQYTLEAMMKIKFDLWVASHASQFNLHEKRKEGDSYHPGLFADRPLYEASLNRIKHDYNRRIKE